MGLREQAIEAVEKIDWQAEILARLSTLGVAREEVELEDECEGAVIDAVWQNNQLIEGLIFHVPTSGPGLDVISMDDDGESRWLGTVHSLADLGYALIEA